METGLVVGKFFPFHRGHLDLINFAKTKVDKVVVLMCQEDKFNYPPLYIKNFIGELKKDPNIIPKVMTHQKELDYTYSDTDEEVSKKWAKHIKEKLKRKSITITKVISSEIYGENFSKHLGAENIVYDIDRKNLSVSGTFLRNSLVKNWDLLTESSKKSFQKHIVITGVEGTGKTTFSNSLMKRLIGIGVCIPEYGASYCITNGYPTTEDEFQRIREVQIYTEDVLKAQNTPYVISDTDWRTTDSYESFYLGYKDSGLNRNPNLYILLETIHDNYKTDLDRLPEDKRGFLKDILHRKLINSGVPIKTPEEFIKNLTSETFWNFYNNTVTKEAIVQPGNEG